MRLPALIRSALSRAPVVVLATVLVLATAVQPAVALQQQEGNGGGLIDRVLVRVGDRAILHTEFEAQLNERLSVVAAQLPQNEIDAQMPMLRQGAMAGMVQAAILEIRAEELGISANANEVDRAINNIRETNGLLDDTQWQQALAQSGYTEATLREDIAGNIVQQRMLQTEIARNVVVSRREAEAYYQDNPERFTEPEQVLFQQIIFVYEGSNRAPVRERAESALAELRQGASLSAVGDQFARPADAIQGAEQASWIAPDDLQAEVRTAIQDLTPLAYSDVVEGRFGYHIIQLLDRRAGGLMPFEEVAPGIQGLLQEQKMGLALNEYIGRLIDNVSIEIYAEEFADLREALLQEFQGAPAGPSRER